MYKIIHSILIMGKVILFDKSNYDLYDLTTNTSFTSSSDYLHNAYVVFFSVESDILLKCQ